MHKILLLEDELEIGRNLQFVLRREGYLVDLFSVGDYAVEAAISDQYDLMILDVMIKSSSESSIVTSGLEVARLTNQHKKVPYIILTSRAESHDIMMGLDMGAEDYITKPYDLSVLLARVRAVLRRTSVLQKEAAPGELTCGDISLNLITHKVFVREMPIQLSNQLFDLLHYFMQHKGKIVSRNELYKDIWGYDPGHGTETNTLEVNIKRLRKQIGPKYITTVRGKGYVLEEPSS